MPLSTAALERAGIHLTVEDLARLMNVAVEQALPPYTAIDARRALPPAELEFWQNAGVDLDEFAPLERGTVPPELRTAAIYAGLLASAFTVSQAAQHLGVDASRVRQRLANQTLYGVRVDGAWRLPLFQFADDLAHILPAFGDLVALFTGLHPVDVATWFTSPHVDLTLADDDRVSPRNWLLGGG